MRSYLLLMLFCLGSLSAQTLTPRDARNDLFRDQAAGPSRSAPQALRSLGEEPVSEGQKSVPMAAISSLLLPGMGELYVGRYSSGKYFTIAEGALWLTYASFQFYGNWVQDDARDYARQHAQAPIGGQSDQYFVDIGNFNSIDAFNQEMLRERLIHKVYSPLSAYYWNWDTPSNRESYRQLRVSSDAVFNNSRFVIGAIVINHIVSAVNAARMALKHNAGLGTASEGIDIRAETIMGPAGPGGIMLSISKTF